MLRQAYACNIWWFASQQVPKYKTRTTAVFSSRLILQEECKLPHARGIVQDLEEEYYNISLLTGDLMTARTLYGPKRPHWNEKAR